MASNTLSGDWRWASTRKSGMTILGKVPKPINLPSQRLENNGLDPNVEIVPKGTLTWGSRASSATPNVWSSSTLLSPKTDGSTGSPSNYSGRPSSGGSGTRPSTAGSDRSQDPSQNARGSNSRPSTASGLLPSNQSPTVAARPRSAETRPMVAARPRSAETRPGSSQLSRFAENSSEPAVAWGTPRTAEKLGVASSKTDEFSLSSGDFPTLGSDKKSESHSQQGHSSQGHSVAASATLRPSENLELPLSGDRFVEHENASTLRTERNSYAEGGSPLNVKLQNNPQQAQPHQSSKMTSHQFDSWRGPPVHPPDRVWYRGGAICGPYRPAGPPSSFPVDPFACYPRPFPPNSQAVPRSGAGLGNHHSTNGDTYCPQAPPNSYMFPSHPVIPARPGPYQAPVPYDGYYSYHQASLGSSGEQPITSMRVAGRPSLYNQRPNHNGNFTSGDFQNSPGGDDSQMTEEQIPSDRAHVPHQGHYKVLLKPHGDLENNHPQEKGQYGSSTSTHFDSEHKPGGSNSKQEGEQSIGSRENETAKLMKLMNDHKGPSKLASDCEGQPSNPVPTNSEENSCRTSEGILKRESDIAIPVVHDQKHNSIMRKNTALIEKIEGLNNKIRCADSLSDVGQLPFRQERSKQPKVFNAKPERSAKVIFLNASPTENASTFSITAMPVSFEESSSNDPKSSTMVIPASSEASPLNVINNSKLSIDSTVTGPLESQGFGLMKPDFLMPGEAAYSHVPKRIHATQSRGDYHAKSRMDTQVDIGWTRESSVRDSSVVLVEKTVTDVPVVGILDNHSSKETILISSSDSLDHKAQRAKLKEMAAQRAKQLQEEEEERTREQKAKALAKLEELNRRAAAQSMKQKLNNTLSPRNSVQHQEDSGVDTASETNAVTINPPGDILVGNIDSFFQTSGSENKKHGTSVALPLNSASHNSKTVSQDSTAPIVPSLSMEHKTNTTEVTSQDGSQSHVTGGSKHKQMGYRRRQKVPLEKNAGEKPIMMENAGLKYLDEVVHDRNPDEKPVTAENKESPENLVKVNTPLSNSDMLLHNGDPSLQHKKKNSRNSRNKNKDEALMGSSISVPAHSNENSEECRSESFKSHPAVSVTAQVFLENSESQDSRDGVVHSHQRCSKIIEEAHGRMSNQWKPQPPRRPARNQQIIRSMDKVHGSETVIWAPIKPANKNEQSEEISQSSSVDYQSSQRNEHDMHNGMRTKRAEMERYVPKPVAKELLQQENTRKSSTYFNQSASGNMPEKSYSDSKGTGMGKCDGSSVGNTEVIADTKKGEDKPSKRSRAHASWRQRSSSETTLQSSNESLNSSDATKHFNKRSDQHLSSPEQLKSDGWESSSNPVPKDLVVLPDVIKDQGITSRLRCQQVHRVAGSNYAVPDHHHLQSGIDDKSGMGSHILDLNETDARNSIRGDNKNIVGEHIRPHSQWKPKSQTCSQNQQQGNRGNEGQRKFSHDGRSKKFSSLCFESNPSCNENKSALPLKDDSHVVTDAGHQDTMGAEMGTCKSDLSKEQMHITEPDAPTNTALPPGDVNAQHQNQVSPPPRRHGHRNGRFNRGQEATYRSRDLSQISGVSNVQINGDQRRNNSHFGYQPIGSYNKPSDLYQSNSNIDQEAQGHHASRQRYKERVQTQTGNPGHFIRRNSGAAAHDD